MDEEKQTDRVQKIPIAKLVPFKDVRKPGETEAQTLRGQAVQEIQAGGRCGNM